MNDDLPLISICIPLWERDEHFDKLIASMKLHDAGMPYEICIGEGHNPACVNRNLAMRKARSNYIVQMDGDAAIIQDGWLLKLYETLMSDSTYGVVGCIVELYDGTVDHCGTICTEDKKKIHERLQSLYAHLPLEDQQILNKRIRYMAQVIDYDKSKHVLEGNTYTVFQPSGVCFMFDRRNTGMFLEIFDGAGWEDADFFARIQAMGMHCAVDGRVRVQHPNHERSTEEIEARDPKSERGFKSRNLMQYALTWGAI